MITPDTLSAIPPEMVAELQHLSNAAIVTLGQPHELLTHPTRGDYLEKWRLDEKDDGSATLIHRILRSDGDQELHDHPWDNRTIVLSGGYWDVTPEGRRWLGAGSILHRRAGDFHRVELADGIIPVTMFSHGPRIQDWGFLGEDGVKIPAAEFISRQAG